MVSTVVQFDRANLDRRLLWSATQSTLSEKFQQLVAKCEALGERSPLVLVTTDAVDAHLIAAFNLASAFSGEMRTMLVDTTPDQKLVSGLLQVEDSEGKGLFLVHQRLALAGLRDDGILPDGWPTRVFEQVGEKMIALLTARDAFQVDWTKLDLSVKVVALASPNELEEERWNHLLQQVSSQRFLGLWVVD